MESLMESLGRRRKSAALARNMRMATAVGFSFSSLLLLCLATAVIFVQEGESREAAVDTRAQAAAARPLTRYLRPGAIPNGALSRLNTSATLVIEADAQLAAPHVAALLNQLSTRLSAALPDTRLVVRRAFLPPPANLLESSGLHHEGRAVDLGLLSVSGAALPADAVKTLAALTADVGFNYVVLLSDGKTVHAAATDSTCHRPIDLAFLVDGSGSISQADYTRALGFVGDVAAQFDLRGNATRIGLSIFSGSASHMSTIAGVPDCPVGTYFEANGLGCICPVGTPCKGSGCRAGQLSTTNELVYYYPSSCTVCACDLDQGWVSQPAAETVFILGQHVTQAAVHTAAAGADFPKGGTQTSDGLKHIRENVFTVAGGARSAGEGVPRILIVLTDGQANPGYEPAAEAALLHATGVTVFAVGIGAYNRGELLDMASSPKSDRVFELASFNDLVALAKSLAPLTCFAPSLLEPEGPTLVVLPRDSIGYYRVDCTPLPGIVTVSVRVLAGTVAVFISTSTSTPGPADYELYALNVRSSDGPAVFSVNRRMLAAEHGVDISPDQPPVYVSLVAVGLDGESTATVQAAAAGIAGVPPYTALPEDAPAQSVLLTPSSVAPAGQVYTIAAGNNDAALAVDAHTGAVTLARSLDYEVATRRIFVLQLAANNRAGGGGACSTAVSEVELRVLDVNDNAPVFVDTNSMPLAAVQWTALELAQGAASMTRRLGRVRAIDADSVVFGAVVYSLSASTPAGFWIDAANGEVWTNTSLDFEAQASVTLLVGAHDGGSPPKSAVPLQLTIRVIDALDEPPRFDRDLFEGIVTVDTIGSPVLTLSATDADDGDALRFELARFGNGAASFLASFILNPVTGELFPSGALDTSTAAVFTTRAHVFDSAGAMATATVSVAVQNANRAPHSLRLDKVTVDETATPHAVLGTLLATDDPRQTLRWTLLSSSLPGIVVDTGSTPPRLRLGAAGLGQGLRAGATVSLRLNCSDNGSPPLSATLDAVLTVVEVGESPLLLQLVPAEPVVPETALVGTQVALVIAHDPDASETLRLSLQTTGFGRFRLGGLRCSSSGNGTRCEVPLLVAAALDYESAASWTLTARATDTAGAAIAAVLRIRVGNVNEPPSDVRLSPAAIAENAAVGHVVGRLSASDPEGQNVTWSIPNMPAQLRQRAGEPTVLEVAAPLDYESSPQLTFVAIATDDGVPARAVEVELRLAVVNVNEPPAWSTNQKWETSLALPAAAHDVVATVQVSDADSPATPFGRVRFRQLSHTTMFTTHADTGEVRVTAAAALPGSAAALVPGALYAVELVAEDGGGLFSPVGVLNVSIAVGPGDLTLALVPDSVPENAVVGSSIATVEVTGIAANRAIRLELSGADADAVAFVPEDGTSLQLQQSLDYEAQSVLLLSVAVYDAASGAKLRAPTPLRLAVDNINEAPVLARQVWRKTLPEDVAGATAVVQLAATDPDRDAVFGGLSFSWAGATALAPPAQLTLDTRTGAVTTNAFVVDALSGRFTAVGFDHETAAQLALEVSVTDGGGLVSTAQLILNVSDVNEAPVFAERSPTVRVAEDTLPGSVLALFAAEDPDRSAAFRGLRYYAVGGDVAVLSIDVNTGQLLLRQAVNYEVRRAYTLRVRVVDALGLQDEMLVAVEITNVNEAPGFASSRATVVIEPLASGETLQLPLARDFDVGVCGQLTYAVTALSTLNGPLYADAWTHDTATNVLTSRVTVPAKAQYALQLTAADGCGVVGNASLTLTVSRPNAGSLTLSLTAATVAENATIDAVVGHLRVQRNGVALPATSLEIVLVSGANGRFVLGSPPVGEADASAVLRVAANSALDYEQAAEHAVVFFVRELTTRDYVERTLSVAVQDVNEAPRWNDAATSTALLAAAPVTPGQSLGTLVADDPDAGVWGVVVFRLVNTTLPVGSIEVLPSGAVRAATSATQAQTLQAGMAGQVVVAMEDGGGLAAETRVLSVAIAAAGGSPVLAGAPWTVKMATDQPLGSSILTLEAAAPAGTEVTYALVSGDAYGLLALNPRTGQVVSVAVPAMARLPKRRRRGENDTALPAELDLSKPLTVVFRASTNLGHATEGTLTLAFFEGCSPEPCLPGYACAGLFSADSWQTCVSESTYEVVAPSTHRDRICVACTTCGQRSYNSGGCTAGDTEDRTCTPVTMCTAGVTYAATPATPTSQTLCAPCSSCASGQVLVRRCTAATDTVCAPQSSAVVMACASGEYRRAADKACVRCTTCPAGHYAVADTCDGVSDRVCRPHTVCRRAQEYLHFSGTATADAECRRCTLCPAGVGLLSPCTATADTVCNYKASRAPVCTCPPGRRGATCEELVDLCASSPCTQGSTCIQDADALLGFRCVCPELVFGALCEHRGAQCVAGASDPCPPPQTCSVTDDSTGEFICLQPVASTTSQHKQATTTTTTTTASAAPPSPPSRSGRTQGSEGGLGGSTLAVVICGALVGLVLLLFLLLLLKRRRDGRHAKHTLTPMVNGGAGTAAAPSLVAYTNPVFDGRLLASAAHAGERAEGQLAGEGFAPQSHGDAAQLLGLKTANVTYPVNHYDAAGSEGDVVYDVAGAAYDDAQDPSGRDGEYANVSSASGRYASVGTHRPGANIALDYDVATGGVGRYLQGTSQAAVGYDTARPRNDPQYERLPRDSGAVVVYDAAGAKNAAAGYATPNQRSTVAYDMARRGELPAYDARLDVRPKEGYDNADAHPVNAGYAAVSDSKEQLPIPNYDEAMSSPRDKSTEAGYSLARDVASGPLYDVPTVDAGGGYDAAGGGASGHTYDMAGMVGGREYAAGNGSQGHEYADASHAYDQARGNSEPCYARAGHGSAPGYDVAHSGSLEDGGYDRATGGTGGTGEGAYNRATEGTDSRGGSGYDRASEGRDEPVYSAASATVQPGQPARLLANNTYAASPGATAREAAAAAAGYALLPGRPKNDKQRQYAELPVAPLGGNGYDNIGENDSAQQASNVNMSGGEDGVYDNVDEMNDEAGYLTVSGALDEPVELEMKHSRNSTDGL